MQKHTTQSGDTAVSRQFTTVAMQDTLPNTPMVSVICFTYNHAPFIAQTIDSFLMQSVDFGVEILIHDDASNDGTQQIVAEYAAQYPGCIRAILQDQNQFSNGVNFAKTVRAMAHGKYLAYCEGDDFWCDSRKLALQVGLLESSAHYVMCGHSAYPIDAAGQKIPVAQSFKRLEATALQRRDLTGQELKELIAIPRTCTRMIRNIPDLDPPEKHLTSSGDAFIQSILGGFGGYKFMPEIEPSAYRLHQKGMWNGKALVQQRREVRELLSALIAYHARIGDKLTVYKLRKRRLRHELKMILKWGQERIQRAAGKR